MTQDLHDRIDELVADVAAYVVPDARAAWAAGARRRTRHRLGAGAVAAVVLALLVGALTWLPRTLDPTPARPDGAGAEGYPVHVVQPWTTQDLPTAPGPMAMLVEQSDGQWWVADAGGRSWRVPQEGIDDDYPPALSPDGRWLGHLSDQTSYLVRDLVTGDADTSFSLDGGGEPGTGDEPWVLGAQTPSFWSPDSRLLLLRAGRTADAVVLDPRSTFDRGLRQGGYPVGWLDERTTAWLVPAAPGRPTRLVGVDLRGRVASRVDLELRASVGEHLDQWSGSVSPDGRRIAVRDGTGAVWVLRTGDGRRIGWKPLGAADSCLVSWRDEQPIVFAAAALGTMSSEQVTSFDVGGEIVCAMGASDALAGEPHPGMGWWAQATGWAQHHPLTLAIWVVLLSGAAALLIAGRRRRRLAPTS